MRALSIASLTLAACLAAAPTRAASPQLLLTDPGYALWEIRPLDRRVYVLTLEGDWKTPPDFDAEYYVNIEYPHGTVRHRTLNNFQFWKGDVECLLIQYQWQKYDLQKGDPLTVYVSRKRADVPLDDQAVVSNRLVVTWPFDRPVVRLAPRTKFTEREPVDAFHAPAELLPPPKPAASPEIPASPQR